MYKELVAESWTRQILPPNLFDIMNTTIPFIQHTAMFQPYISSYLPICYGFASTHILKIAAEMLAFTWI